MVAQFVRLKLTLMGNTFRRSVWQTIGFLVGALYGLFVVGMLVVIAGAAMTSRPEPLPRSLRPPASDVAVARKPAEI